jgi:hypothetical protein
VDDPAELVAEILIVRTLSSFASLVPAGVPEISPVWVFRARPLGKEPLAIRKLLELPPAATAVTGAMGWNCATVVSALLAE